MKVTIEPTDEIVMTDGVPCRVWDGTTERGTKVLVFVRAIAVPTLTCSEEEMKDLVELQQCDEPQPFAVTEFRA